MSTTAHQAALDHLGAVAKRLADAEPGVIHSQTRAAHEAQIHHLKVELDKAKPDDEEKVAALAAAVDGAERDLDAALGGRPENHPPAASGSKKTSASLDVPTKHDTVKAADA